MFENIDTSLIDWSRAQFALTAMYHWSFRASHFGIGCDNGAHGDLLCDNR